ncbi:hypothetical protein [Nonlabens sp. Asnod3-A02]|uniref:hypothetical protein n=1 Tax=Nonlabens sp. Asnod3-A02 TaxID=3160579 RepID=UPI003867D278
MSKSKLNKRRDDFKFKIISILENNIDDLTVERINSCASKNAVRKVICELTEHHNLLRENGIKAIYPTSKKTRPNFKGAEFDQTINSVRTIYTPMGNKR